MNRILVVDDELSIRESFSLILEGKYKVLPAASGEGALKAAADQKIDLAYLDIRMPGLDGLETLKRIKEIDPELEVIMVTAVNDVQKASEAIRLGARDYVVKPFDVETILKMTELVLRRKALQTEGAAIQKRKLDLIGQSEKIIEIIKTIENSAAKNTKVLILGEPGTEKEIIARLFHEGSPRAELPFSAFHLSEGMSSPEIHRKLFGATRGSTTADLEKRTGLIDAARGGTLFLNHIEYLTSEISFLQSTEARLIGGSNLADFAEKSKEVFEFFSETVITIPPLRERIPDLPLLINYFLEKFAKKYGRETLEIAPEATETLSNYTWPGNTAELEALLEKLVITSSSHPVTSADLPLDILLKGAGTLGSDYLSAFEKEFESAQGRTRTGTASR